MIDINSKLKMEYHLLFVFFFWDKMLNTKSEFNYRKIAGNSQKKSFLKYSPCFKKLKKNSNITNYITEKYHTKYYTSINICKIFCNVSSFTHHF